MARGTLKAQLAADVAGVFLDTDDFAETVEYSPHGGAARSIAVVIEEDSGFEGDGHNETETDRLEVYCARSASTGIDRPKLLDTIKRAAASDPQQRPYAYAGEKREVTADAWVLIFERARRTGAAPA